MSLAKFVCRWRKVRGVPGHSWSWCGQPFLTEMYSATRGQDGASLLPSSFLDLSLCIVMCYFIFCWCGGII